MNIQTSKFLKPKITRNKRLNGFYYSNGYANIVKFLNESGYHLRFNLSFFGEKNISILKIDCKSKPLTTNLFLLTILIYPFHFFIVTIFAILFYVGFAIGHYFGFYAMFFLYLRDIFSFELKNNRFMDWWNYNQ